MTITPSSLLFNVRRELSDVPEDHADDAIIYQMTVQANDFCNEVIDVASEDESYIEHCVITLAAYFVYLNYTSLTERQLGTIPPTTVIRLNELRRKAYVFISKVTIETIDEYFNIDDSGDVKVRPNALGLVEKVSYGIYTT